MCEAAGLVIMRSHWAGHVEGHAWQYAVSASDVELLLAEAPMMSLSKNVCQLWTALEPLDGLPYTGDTHTARLVLIQPIRPIKPKDTLESLLREIIDCPAWRGSFKDLRDRAKALLDGKK